jgi:NAD(P)-dependent dehydrogenase (short-subunit alcohol dehydrogenase family)/acyl carrier protein
LPIDRPAINGSAASAAIARLAAVAKAPIVAASPADPTGTHQPPQNGSTALPGSNMQTGSGALGNSTATNGGATNGAAPVGRAALTDHLISVVEDRTGYPRDMLGMNQNLEADLGIDSIKRVEIVGALLKWLPPEVRSKTADIGEALNREKTLAGIVDLVWSKIEAEAGVPARPFDGAGADVSTESACARPPRFLMVAHAQELPQPVPTALPAGIYVITDDGAGLAAALAQLVEAAGGQPKIVSADPGVLDEFDSDCDKSGNDRIVGFVHLAPFGTRPISPPNDPSAWRHAVQANELFPHQFVRRVRSLQQPQRRILLISGLGGTFGRSPAAAADFCIAGGGAALAKTLRQECPGVVAKAIDLPRDRPVRELAGLLFAELAAEGDRIEVGYQNGRRTIFRTEAAEIQTVCAHRNALPDGSVILATGGARGITAEVLHALARPGITLVLAGRSPQPEPEPPAVAVKKTERALRAYLIAQARSSSLAPRPRDVEQELKAIMRNREISASIAELRAAGAEVLYRAVDLRDPTASAALVAEIYARCGRLDGVIHGAGLIEDKRIVDKDPDSWLRVVETKALSAFTIAHALNVRNLRFFIMFGSVAGRYGNSGQADYGAANELLNRFAWQLRALWPPSVKIAVLNWGPWRAGRHGSGMVSADTMRKFEARRLRLIEPAGGAVACRNEILHGPIDDVEIILGEGPWEQYEAEEGAVRRDAGAMALPASSSLLAGDELRA